MSTHSNEELMSLRMRAYGPDADIAEDPAALARLRELESNGSPSGPGMHGAPSPEDDPNPPLTHPEGAGDLQNQVAEGSSRRAWLPRSRRVRVIIGVTLAAALVAVSAIATAAVVDSRPPYAGTRHVTSLTVDDASPWPESLGRKKPTDSRYVDYLGLAVFFIQQGSPDGTECLVVVNPDNRDQDIAIGKFVSGCGGGAFPPTAIYMVTPQSTQAVRDAYPVGTALQFVRKRSDVDVYTDAP